MARLFGPDFVQISFGGGFECGCATRFGVHVQGYLTPAISHRNKGLNFPFLPNFKNPKSLKVGYWGSKLLVIKKHTDPPRNPKLANT